MHRASDMEHRTATGNAPGENNFRSTYLGGGRRDGGRTQQAIQQTALLGVVTTASQASQAQDQGQALRLGARIVVIILIRY